jgi:hypothetical protein
MWSWSDWTTTAFQAVVVQSQLITASFQVSNCLGHKANRNIFTSALDGSVPSARELKRGASATADDLWIRVKKRLTLQTIGTSACTLPKSEVAATREVFTMTDNDLLGLDTQSLRFEIAIILLEGSRPNPDVFTILFGDGNELKTEPRRNVVRQFRIIGRQLNGNAAGVDKDAILVPWLRGILRLLHLNQPSSRVLGGGAGSLNGATENARGRRLTPTKGRTRTGAL